MWIAKKINKNNNSQTASYGKVTLSQNNNVSIRSGVEYRNIPVITPYGMSYVIPLNKSVCVLPTDNGNIAIGTFNKNNNLEAGEVMFYSMGGAKIILKNDGSVIINNTVIPAE